MSESNDEICGEGKYLTQAKHYIKLQINLTELVLRLLIFIMIV